MADVDYYDILDVRPTATAAEIKAAYHRAVRTTHPDAGGTAGMFRLVTDAYRTLSDPQARAAYDAGAGREPSAGSATGTAAPEADWGDEVSWQAGAAEPPPRARRTPASPTDEELVDPGPSRLDLWVVGPHGRAVTRWGGWAILLLFCLFTAVLVWFPGWIRPAAAGSDIFGGLLDHSLVLWIVVVMYGVAAYFAYLGALWGPMAVVHLAVFVLVVVGWPFAYWSLASTGERVAFLGIGALWIVYAVAITILPAWQGDQIHDDREA
ncbi:J domain-containing protein [Jiangella mangrovi]|uniref:J domain-containing protein n=1 Tax=Jiangella mangrovi TaxID=1524084 RepID=A0A7W9GNM9_9ACTN|nr:DnaJ domain-containing protein [Jiangella mangrovi]MBB5787187.1 hypothetical protein [Jiangella mangrovi]